jgi:hypothetical protein
MYWIYGWGRSRESIPGTAHWWCRFDEEVFLGRLRAPNSPVCVIYYMLSSGGFAAACLQTIAKGGSSILGHPGQTRAMFQASATRRPVHTLTTVEGLLPSFRHRLHGSVGMIFDEHVVYVVICYMSIICYMPVICLVQIPPQEEVVVLRYIEGPFLVTWTDCARELHVPCIEGSFLVSRTCHTRERHTP